MNLLTPIQIKDKLNVCLKTVYTLFARGVIPEVKIPGVRGIRAKEEVIDRLVEEWTCHRERTAKASTKSSLAKGDAEYTKFCQKASATNRPKKGKTGSEVTFITQTS